MAELNHTIVRSIDKHAGAAYLTEILGLAPATSFGPFQVVEVSNGVNLDFMDTDAEIAPQHYAFLVSDEEFDATLGRIRARDQQFWADPDGTRPGEINNNDGGRGIYFSDPSGHWLEILTVAHGG